MELTKEQMENLKSFLLETFAFTEEQNDAMDKQIPMTQKLFESIMYISEELTIPHGQSDHLSRRFRSLISERDSRRSKSFL